MLQRKGGAVYGTFQFMHNLPYYTKYIIDLQQRICYLALFPQSAKNTLNIFFLKWAVCSKFQLFLWMSATKKFMYTYVVMYSYSTIESTHQLSPMGIRNLTCKKKLKKEKDDDLAHPFHQIYNYLFVSYLRRQH